MILLDLVVRLRACLCGRAGQAGVHSERFLVRDRSDQSGHLQQSTKTSPARLRTAFQPPGGVTL